MKMIIALAALLAVALAAPVDDKNAEVLSYENDNIGVGDYKYSFDTSNGISRKEEAQLKNVGTEDEALVVRGTISWVDAEGTPFSLTYTADENGFHAEGAHLPKA